MKSKLVKTPKYSKSELREISINGFKYAGFWEGMYHWSKEVESYKYINIAVFEENIYNGNLEYMLEKGLTNFV